ncbi:MAG TPA: YceI family protein [Steroidobacteraceae bacterium]|jgi:polyisoprenoid-binding protein YceI
MQRFVLLLALAALAACSQKNTPPQAQTESPPAAPAAAPAAPAEPAGEPSSTAAHAAKVPAGDYKLDKAHTTLLFRVSHMGFSHYTARFRRIDAELHFDPNNLTATQLTATVDARSIETDYPDPKYDFNGELQGEGFLNAGKFPQISFRTTQVEDLGNNALRVHGDLTLRGVTKPIVLDVTYNGGYPGFAMDPQARVGFSAHGVLRRSEYGITGGIPLAGTNMGVGDQVEIRIESEFNGPPAPQPESKS